MDSQSRVALRQNDALFTLSVAAHAANTTKLNRFTVRSDKLENSWCHGTHTPTGFE